MHIGRSTQVWQIDQREVGLDTQSLEEALRHAMRGAPDVIMIGEIRDRETLHQSLYALYERGDLTAEQANENPDSARAFAAPL